MKIYNKSTPDELEEMTCRWNTCYVDIEGKKIPEEYRQKLDKCQQERIGFDKSKVELFPKHVTKRGHLQRSPGHPNIKDNIGKKTESLL
ncbi:hypothetical protein Tco_0995047 [Tanacetum coccineum]